MSALFHLYLCGRIAAEWWIFMKEILSQLGPVRLTLLSLCIPLAVIAYFYKFVFPGYGFTAMVCVLLICILCFYALIPLAAPAHPLFVKWSLWIVSLGLCAVLVAGIITEGVILKASKGSPETDTPYLLVLGAKVNKNAPSVSLLDRIHAAYDYLIVHPDTLAVLSGGQGPDEPISEARCMYDYLVEMGIPPHQLLMEDRSTSTRENFRFSLDLLEQVTGQRPTELGVVSSEYHLFRAGLCADAFGIDFIGIPARTVRFTQRINYFMREVVGVWYYILLGGNYS